MANMENIENKENIKVDKNISMSDHDKIMTDNDKISTADSVDPSNCYTNQEPSQKDSFKCPKLPSKNDKLNDEMCCVDKNLRKLSGNIKTDVKNDIKSEQIPVSTLKKRNSCRESKYSKNYAQSKNKFISLTTLYVINNALKCNVLIKECLRIWVEGGLDKFKVVTLNIDENDYANNNNDHIDKLTHLINSCDGVGFLLENFEGSIFQYLVICRQFVVGPTFVTEFLTEYGVTPIKLMSCRPMYCSSMLKITVLFDGFADSDSETIRKMAKRVCFMGGHVGSMLDSCTTTHLVTPSVLHSKLYQEAMDMRVAVVRKEWIDHCWDRRNELDYIASMDTVEDFEVRPFHGVCIAFLGFSADEIYQLEEAAHMNGAVVSVDIDDHTVTHIVCENKEKLLNESKSSNLILNSKNVNIFTVNWFWKCIHMERYYGEDVAAYLNTTSRCDESVAYGGEFTESITSMSAMIDSHVLSINTTLPNVQLPYPNIEESTNISETVEAIKTLKIIEEGGIINADELANSQKENQENIDNNWTLKDDFDTNCLIDDQDITPIKAVGLKKQSTLTDSKYKMSNLALNDQLKSDTKKDINNLKENIVGDEQSATLSNNVNLSMMSTGGKPKVFKDNVSFDVIKNIGPLIKFASISAHSPKCNIDNKVIRKRELIVDELISTETNYVKILKTIIDVFYRPLEKLVKASNKPIITSTDLKFMFSAFPHMHNIHSNFLSDLELMKKHMAFKHICVGTLMLNHIERYPKAYAPYVNYYDLIYNSIKEWSDNNPRFYAFLKSCEMDPRCKRESLQQLFIRPIQRLPSTLLILNQIVDLVLPAEPDHKYIIKSIQILKDIIKSLNEGKRLLESKMRMFSIINHVEKCPANIMSIGRDLIRKFEAVEKTSSKMFAKNGRQLVVYLLNDGVEIATKKLLKIISKSVINSAKQIMSSNTSAQSSNVNADNTSSYIGDVNNVRSDKDKPFKHYLYLDFKDIHSIYNIVPNNTNRSKDVEYSSESISYHSAPTTPTSSMVGIATSSSNVSSNTLGLLFYVDRFHYNFIYFKIHGKNAAADKDLFIRELATKIAHYRNLDSYQQAIIESPHLISTKDDLVFATDENSTSDITFNDEISIGGSYVPMRCSSVSISNLQSPFHAVNSNLFRLKDVVGNSNHSILSGGNITMIKLKKTKKYGGSKGLFSSTTSASGKGKPLERSCSTACSSKYAKKKLASSATSFCNSQQDRESSQANESSTNDCVANKKHKKKRDSINCNSSSRFSINFTPWKRNSGFGLIGKKDSKCRQSTGSQSNQQDFITDSTDPSDTNSTPCSTNSNIDLNKIKNGTPSKKTHNGCNNSEDTKR